MAVDLRGYGDGGALSERFVAVIQSFAKISFLHALAPTQSEPPFLIAQLVVLALFVVLGFLSVRKFHPQVA